MSHFPEWVPASERAIINGVITRAFKAGLSISVYDGEEWALNRSQDRAAIQRETAATDETVYMLREVVSDLRIGKVWFVHGNGEDVLSDYSWNADLTEVNAEAIMAEICKTES